MHSQPHSLASDHRRRAMAPTGDRDALRPPSTFPSTAHPTLSSNSPVPSSLSSCSTELADVDICVTPRHPARDVRDDLSNTTNTTTSTSRTLHVVPHLPLPDSLLCRSTFSALEHSATTLKRLTKNVLSASTAVLSLYDQLDRAEDDLAVALGELGRWLEGGYGVSGDVWDDQLGYRRVAREKRKREKEELEIMVVHAVSAVKGEVKRQGLGGGGAQQRFETTARSFYSSTGGYLSETNPSPDTSLDKQQAARTAQFDLVRYNFHSTLLYAVPPSSVGCLDLLVGLYGWVGAQLSCVPGRRADTHPHAINEFASRPHLAGGNPGGAETPTQKGRQLAASETPVGILSRDDERARGSVESLARTLSQSLAHLVQVRSDLLLDWAARDQQTTALEENVKSFSSPASTTPVTEDDKALSSAVPSAPYTTKEKRRSKIGGKLKGLFSGSSASSLPGLADRAASASEQLQASQPSKKTDPSRKTADVPIKFGNTIEPPVPPLRRMSTDLPREPRVRHSYQPEGDKPAIVSGVTRSHSRSQSLQPPLAPAFKQTPLDEPDFSVGRLTVPPSDGRSPNSPTPSVGGVGGLNGGGDEDEAREMAGRRKEGVLWGTACWEPVASTGTRGRWERVWVVLAHSTIYEHRDTSSGKPDSAATVIDLRFASVREGRSDRRFTFEVITPAYGRRVYQATSDSEAKTWIYALVNAIESCINGTATMRPGDLTRYAVKHDESGDDYGSKDDKVRNKSSKAPVAFARSPPPTDPESSQFKSRRPSFKARLKQSAHGASDLMSAAVGGRPVNRNSVDGGQRPFFLAQGGKWPSYASSSGHSGGVSSGVAKDDMDTDIANRVHEMAGLGMGILGRGGSVSRSVSGHPPPPLEETLLDKGSLGSSNTSTAGRSSSSQPATEASTPNIDPPLRTEDGPPSGTWDMARLRQIAATTDNSRCADCGRGTKSSRWATISLRDVPMVMFLCIRCVGIHRSLGTHISKPRSVDLDNWSPETVYLAYQWGNTRGNAVWQRLEIDGPPSNDEDLAALIQAKYVEGRWLGDNDRAKFGLSARSGGPTYDGDGGGAGLEEHDGPVGQAL